MNKIEWNKRSILPIIAWIALICLVVAALFADVLAKEADVTTDAPIQESAIQLSPKVHPKFDSFSVAIIGISMGCMFIVSAVHWNLSQRRQLEAQMQTLDNFLASTCAVEFHIAGSKDDEPMINRVHALRDSRDMKIIEHENNRKITIAIIADVESHILRMWG